jgi:hypothetical protein
MATLWIIWIISLVALAKRTTPSECYMYQSPDIFRQPRSYVHTTGPRIIQIRKNPHDKVFAWDRNTSTCTLMLYPSTAWLVYGRWIRLTVLVSRRRVLTQSWVGSRSSSIVYWMGTERQQLLGHH